MVSSKSFKTNGTLKIYSIDFEILSDSHCKVYLDNTLVSDDTYDIINNSIVFAEAPSEGQQLVVFVSTTPEETIHDFGYLSTETGGTIAGDVEIEGKTTIGNSDKFSAHANYDDLKVMNEGHSGVTIFSNNDSFGGLMFRDEDSTNIGEGYMYYDHSTDSMTIGGKDRLSLGTTTGGISTMVFTGNDWIDTYDNLNIKNDDQGVQLYHEGRIELSRTNGAYIDFKTTSTEDMDARIAADTNGQLQFKSNGSFDTNMTIDNSNVTIWNNGLKMDTTGHITDGGEDFGMTINSYEPGIKLIDKTTGAGSSVIYHNSSAFVVKQDTLNDGTVGSGTNTTDKDALVLDNSVSKGYVYSKEIATTEYVDNAAMQASGVAESELLATDALSISNNTLSLNKKDGTNETVPVAAQKGTSTVYGGAKFSLSGTTLTITTL